jgi:hypothetical protein
MAQLNNYRKGAMLVALLLTLAAIGPRYATAQASTCFAETGFCIGGRFAQYWQQNGGLPVFGYPISNELTEGGRTAQYFERQRFELHTENAPPYDVLLGLLGEEGLQQQGIDWQTQPVSPGPIAGCMWFPETRHNVCDQPPGDGFASYWASHGLEFDAQPGKRYAESLALFGLPITEPFQSTINGQSLQVQWFERARFEWHPENPVAYHVLLGRLGVEMRPAAPVAQAYDTRTSPVDLLASFYNAINRQEYARAYGYWETPPSSYDQFAAGYANTAAVQLIIQPPTFIDVAAGNARAAIPTALVTTLRNGGREVFVGCYVAHKVNIEPSALWGIERAQVAQVDADAALPPLLAQACAAFDVPAPATVSYDNRTSPVDLLASFYNAINRQEYARAYGYWETPPSNYDQFAAGYADTTVVQLLIVTPANIQGAAGSSFVGIRSVVIATRSDGSRQTFAGCYTARASNVYPDGWRLFGATIAPVPGSPPVAPLLAQSCG